MTEDYTKVRVGDLVWWSDVNRKGLTAGVVTKVGSKLITTAMRNYPEHNTYVFRKETGLTNDAYNHQRLIVDVELYEADREAGGLYSRLLRELGYARAAGVTSADIREAAKILKITL